MPEYEKIKRLKRGKEWTKDEYNTVAIVVNSRNKRYTEATTERKLKINQKRKEASQFRIKNAKKAHSKEEKKKSKFNCR